MTNYVIYVYTYIYIHIYIILCMFKYIETHMDIYICRVAVDMVVSSSIVQSLNLHMKYHIYITYLYVIDIFILHMNKYPYINITHHIYTFHNHYKLDRRMTVDAPLNIPIHLFCKERISIL
jgi:hypothetical protein